MPLILHINIDMHVIKLDSILGARLYINNM